MIKAKPSQAIIQWFYNVLIKIDLLTTDQINRDKEASVT